MTIEFIQTQNYDAYLIENLKLFQKLITEATSIPYEMLGKDHSAQRSEPKGD